MKHSLIALLAVFAVASAGCVTRSAGVIATNTDTTALSTYATIGRLVDAYEGPKCGSRFCDATAERLRGQAWSLLQQEHDFYRTGATASALTALQGLQALVGTVKGL